MQDVFNDHGSEDVEFEMTIASTDSDSDVVTHNLAADHSEGFTLSGVNFTGHDGWAGFVFGEEEFTETTSGTRTEESDIVGDLQEG